MVAMAVWVWFGVLAVVVLFGGGGAWLAEAVRAGRLQRHEQRMELLRAEERRLDRLEAAAAQPEPVCGCGHHLAKHDRQGHCHEIVRIPTGWDAQRRPLGFERGACNCQQYIGPQPLSQVWAEGLTDREPGPLPPGGDRGPDEGEGEDGTDGGEGKDGEGGKDGDGR
ncbi:hypothetical protein SAMN05421773_10151 [Streptomyces aidingensis]|uniref:Uncharacterized protein n=1 Tax=Streptomyces aidingensis TaxID=910347 RepID=A0A1I1DZ42_9ACTN|nr:hypothetical protein SAMN05421773_10151 [Streptomyces aidingensis]